MSLDRQLQEAVLAQLQWEPDITAAHIGVAADNGIVTLTGHVPGYHEKHAAETAAARVNGVKAVAQKIEVLLPVQTQRSDEDIARAAVDRLAWESAIPRDAIKVKVEEGWVTLSGTVPWHYQRDAAERLLQGLYGIVGITNLTTIEPRPDAGNIGHDIDTALHRGWLDPKTITVSVDGGCVKLTGTVQTPDDRLRAASDAWASPGTTEVKNELVVIGRSGL